jgi:hypothetical protein
MHPGQRFDQGGFTCAVVAQKAMHFATPQAKGHTTQGNHWAKKLTDVF